MTFHKFILTTATAGMTATLALAAEDDMASDRNDVGSYDGVMIEQGMTGASDTAVVDELGKSERANTMDTAEAENVLTAATTGAEVETVNGERIGKVSGLWSPEGESKRYVVVAVAEEAGIPAKQIGFEISALEAVETGGLEYSNTLAQLREDVAEKAGKM